jgi:hypothetical protein
LLAIGVHFPKSSGTSLLAAMRRHFGQREVVTDYRDGPTFPDGQRQLDPHAYLQRRDMPPNGARVIFGHFHPAKYQHLTARRFTILRHPVDVFLSIYFFWRATPPSSGLHRYVVEANLSIRDMLRLPALSHLMSKSYFEGVDMKSFDVIGRFEDHSTTKARICELLDMPLFSDHENRTPASAEREEAHNDAALRAHLTHALRDDIAFYERWACQ